MESVGVVAGVRVRIRSTEVCRVITEEAKEEEGAVATGDPPGLKCRHILLL